MKITQPLGFITNQTPAFQWETVDGVTDYNFKLSDNVTGTIVTEKVVIGTSYEATTPLAYGTYAVQVTTGEAIATEVVIVTDTIAQYTIVGREGDVNYTSYKQYQMAIRQQAKQAGQMAANVLSTNANISDLLTDSGDANLVKFHLDTIKQTPGFQADFVEYLTLCMQLVTVASRINKRDPQF
jgi:cell division protein FtsB